MAINPAITTYLKHVESALKAGNATEHTHRPALKSLVESLRDKVVATNEPQRIACGAPDFIVTHRDIPLGYIEAKDVGVDLDRAEDTDQLKRYRSSLNNLILTDYLEFRLFRSGELVQLVRLAIPLKNGALKRDPAAEVQLEILINAFFDSKVPTIRSARELAERMARLAKLIDELIRQAFSREGETGDLHAQLEAFRKVLIADLSVDQFADMYAQTIAYGLFAARCNHVGPNFKRELAGRELPKTNPFLRRLFNSIAGNDLDERIAWAVDDLTKLLARADMPTILADFGKATRQEDPVVHFYETFLAAYDPELRELRGVYYTPEPVVEFIVKSVDSIVKREFKLGEGLADSAKIKLKKPKQKGSREETYETHRVQLLDPACGTGTFLHSVVRTIREKFKKNQGLWPSYVAQHLLPRIYGFELLMAPYAVAHMKLGIQLKESGYDFKTDERLRVYLTNTLEEAHELTGLPLFTQWLADEAAAANVVKTNVPIMVVFGNPPYSGVSANRSPWIEDLINDYKKEPDGTPLQERRHWLNDDYVKFIRFAQWRIEKTGTGVLAFITNHGYIDNPTFRGMRSSLMKSFNKIYVIDLHGNSKKKERSPDGSPDKNVFDIQQGAAICLMIKTTTKVASSEVYYHELWGDRPKKYEWLLGNDINSTPWQKIKPEPPFLFFFPFKNSDADYAAFPSIKDIFGTMGLGFQSSRDDLVVDFNVAALKEKIERFIDPTASDDDIRGVFFAGKNVRGYLPGDTRQWSLPAARKSIFTDRNWPNAIRPCLYRPFDIRQILFDERMVDWPRPEVLGHMLHPNMALIVNRQTKDAFGIFCSDIITERKIAAVYDASTTVPLYKYHEDILSGGKLIAEPNINKKYVEELGKKIGAVPSPEEIFFISMPFCMPQVTGSNTLNSSNGISLVFPSQQAMIFFNVYQSLAKSLYNSI